MKVLSFDPGKQLGWVVVDSEQGITESGVYESNGTDKFKLLSSYHRFIKELIQGHPDVDAILCEEVLSGAFNLRSAPALFWIVNTYSLIGKLACAFAESKPFETAHPSTLKKHMTGSGRATKEQVMEVVSRRYGVSLKSSQSHIADAVAMADYYFHKLAVAS